MLKARKWLCCTCLYFNGHGFKNLLRDISEVKDVDPSVAAQDIKNGWMEFEFSYDSDSKNEETSSQTAGASVDATVNAVAYSVSGIYIYQCY